jgi:hypothetical protein
MSILTLLRWIVPYLWCTSFYLFHDEHSYLPVVFLSYFVLWFSLVCRYLCNWCTLCFRLFDRLMSLSFGQCNCRGKLTLLRQMLVGGLVFTVLSPLLSVCVLYRAIKTTTWHSDKYFIWNAISKVVNCCPSLLLYNSNAGIHHNITSCPVSSKQYFCFLFRNHVMLSLRQIVKFCFKTSGKKFMFSKLFSLS